MQLTGRGGSTYRDEPSLSCSFGAFLLERFSCVMYQSVTFVHWLFSGPLSYTGTTVVPLFVRLTMGCLEVGPGSDCNPKPPIVERLEQTYSSEFLFPHLFFFPFLFFKGVGRSPRHHALKKQTYVERRVGKHNKLYNYQIFEGEWAERVMCGRPICCRQNTHLFSLFGNR